MVSDLPVWFFKTSLYVHVVMCFCVLRKRTYFMVLLVMKNYKCTILCNRCLADNCSLFLEPPSFVVNKSREMEEVEEGKSFSEVCRVISELPMNVTWFKGSQIKATGVNSSTLAIDSLKRSDNGTYMCLATNELATIKRFVDLFVTCKYIAILNYQRITEFMRK